MAASARPRPRCRQNYSPVLAVPLDVGAVVADPVEAGEGGVELFVEVLEEARTIALDKAILGAVPLSLDIDGVVEMRRSDDRQEARFQQVIDQALTDDRYSRFFCREGPRDLMCPLGSRRFDKMATARLSTG